MKFPIQIILISEVEIGVAVAATATIDIMASSISLRVNKIKGIEVMGIAYRIQITFRIAKIFKMNRCYQQVITITRHTSSSIIAKIYLI